MDALSSVRGRAPVIINAVGRLQAVARLVSGRLSARIGAAFGVNQYAVPCASANQARQGAGACRCDRTRDARVRFGGGRRIPAEYAGGTPILGRYRALGRGV